MVIRQFLLVFLMLLAFSKLHSQLCNGSLGDPIINITFGSGSNPGQALTTTTNLQYVPYDCPNDGSYTVRNNTSSCFGNTWYTLKSDHTGNTDGYFMLINASLQKSEFYIDTVKGLCPNTTYEYAAWLMNVIQTFACEGNSINPNLTFNIEKTDGSVLKTYSTGDITASSGPVWRQYGFFFKTSDASDVVVRIFNNSTGGCGNDLAIDDITFRACGAKLSPFIVGVEGNVKELCEGDNADITLSAEISEGYNNPSFQWQQSTDNGSTYTDIPAAKSATWVKNITASTPVGNYLYRLMVAEGTNINLPSCRVASSALTIHVNSIPDAGIESNSPVCEGSPVILSASGGSEYVWTGVNAYSASGAAVTINNAKLTDSGKYYVTITSAGRCRQTDSTVVNVIPGTVAATGFDSKTICQGNSVSLHSSGGTSYLWSPAADLSSSVAADVVAKPADTTLYKVVVQNQNGCKDSATILINVSAAPQADAGPDKDILEGESIQLSATADGADVSYSWSPARYINDAHTLQPTVNPTNDVTYFLKVSSNNGCGISDDSVRIHVFKKVTIPNAFSPNGDGVNDTWNIKALNTYNDYDLSVYNRYGQTVFTTKNYSKLWDGSYNGKPLPIGTYYYLIDLKQGLPKLKGYVVILR
jgi:gliding motility-associated-like protein